MVTPVKREPKRRGRKNLPPEKLYETLCRIYPEDEADEMFKRSMGYPPPFAKKPVRELDMSFLRDVVDDLDIVGELED